MINKFKLSVVLIAILGLLQITCKKPNTGLTFSIRSDVMKYTAMVSFVDPTTGNAPANVTMSITGPDASLIYEISGKKNFYVLGGQIALGLDPNNSPTASAPKKFNIIASAPGYLSVNVPVTMNESIKQQQLTVNLVNISNPPPGVTIIHKNLALVNGQLPAAVSFATDTTNGKVDSMTLKLPVGLKFLDSSGNQLLGSSVSVQMVHFDNRTQSSLDCFPGGGNPVSNSVVDASGNSTSKYFTTLGFSDISMTVGGNVVRKFSDSITMTMNINDTTNDINTGSPIQAGSLLSVYSYRVETGVWQYENMRAVTSSGSGLIVTHSTNHLTTYNFAYTTDICPNPQSITITYPALGSNKVTGILNIGVLPAGDNGVFRTYPSIKIPITNQSFPYTVSLGNLPTGQVSIAASLFNRIGSNSANDLCSTPATVNISGGAFTFVTASIVGKCRYDSSKVVSPSFYVDYRLHGSNAQYQLLGFVSNGQFSTPLVTVGKTYDLRATFAGQQIDTFATVTNTVNSISVDMSSTSFCQQ
ncbi:MAG: hypothetical protein WCG87_10330 [Bacteroidota bacterium]